MKSVSKVQFGQLNGKRFYFSNGIMSLPYDHPFLENLRKQNDKYRNIHKVIQTKKDFFKRFFKRRKQGNRKNSKIKYFKTNI